MMPALRKGNRHTDSLSPGERLTVTCGTGGAAIVQLFARGALLQQLALASAESQVIGEYTFPISYIIDCVDGDVTVSDEERLVPLSDLAGGGGGSAATVETTSYTPTVTGVLNADANPGGALQPLKVTRVNEYVHVCGEVEINNTAANTLTAVGITLPASLPLASPATQALTGHAISFSVSDYSTDVGFIGENAAGGENIIFASIKTTGVKVNVDFTYKTSA